MKRRLVISIILCLISIMLLPSCASHRLENKDTETEIETEFETDTETVTDTITDTETEIDTETETESETESETVVESETETETETETDTETETETEIIPSEPVYTLTDDSSFYVVTGYTGNSGAIEIDQIHEGLRVIGISSGAFKDNTNLEEIVIPNSVEKIETSAFEGCTSLKTIVIPTGVREIEKSVFKGCTSLNNVKLHSKIQKINDYAFAECDSLESISLNDGLVSIGNNAFDYCSSLSSIVFPDTVETVGNMAFRYAQKLKSITFSKNLTAIGNATFQYCTGLESVSLPENIVSIGNSAFSFCDGLLELEILGDLTFFGNSAFYECHHIEKIYFCSSTETDLGENNYMLYNAGIKGDGITFTISSDACVPTKMLEPFTDSNHPNIKKIIVEDGATNVNYFSGSDCFPYLEEIKLPETITDITFGIFNNSLWWKEKPNGAVYISKILYGYKGELVSLSIIDGTLLVANDAFENCQDLKTLIIPESIKIIGKNAFASTGITTVRLDNDIEEIRKNAFNGCDSLEKVIFDGNKEELTSLNIAEGNEKLTSAEIKYNCDVCTPGEPVQENYVDSTCTKKGSYDMATYCVDCLKELERTTEHAVDLKPHTPGTAVKENIVDSTCAKEGSYDMATYCEKCNGELERTEYTIELKPHTPSTAVKENFVDSTCAKEGSYDMATYCEKCNAELDRTEHTIELKPHTPKEPVEENRVDSTCTETGSYDMATYCEKCNAELDRTEHTIELKPHTYVNSYTCSECSYVSAVETTSGLTYTLDPATDTYEVGGDSSLSASSVVIPYTYNGKPVTKIASNAFANKTSIKNIIIPDSIEYIGSNAFDGLTLSYNEYDNAYYLGNAVNPYLVLVKAKDKSITSCVINENTKFINYGAFYDCSSLTSIEIPDSVITIGGGAFSGCTSLTSIEIPDSVTSIGGSAFYNCSSLTSIEIPNGVTSIDHMAFYNCSSLTSVTFKNPNGWYVIWSDETITLDSSDLSDASTAASYLTSTYWICYWKRNDS